MDYQSVFERYELKYIITRRQKEKIMEEMKPYMALDKYGRTTIRNIYFDTDNYRLVRQSIDKPVYKEKLRLRSYEAADPKSTVFVELKKKFEDIVYKRRLSMPERIAMDWLRGFSRKINDEASQNRISEEINYFLDYYGSICPAAFLSYEREAFFSLDGSDFRVTFDDTILCRLEDLSLKSDIYGEPVLDSDKILMEIKSYGGIPARMARFLSDEGIYKTSFSKYGTAYRKMIYPGLKEVCAYA